MLSTTTKDDQTLDRERARAAYAAATGVLLEENTETHEEKEGSEAQEARVSKALADGTFTWEWAKEQGIHFPTKDDNWGELLARNPHPSTNPPSFNAEHLMTFVVSDLSRKGCSPVTILVAAYYTTFFNPYKGSLHPEFFRVMIALGITQEEYEQAMEEISSAQTVIAPVSSNLITSGWWLRLNLDAEVKINAWRRTVSGEHMDSRYDLTRRSIVKWNLRYSGIRSHRAQLLSVILACRAQYDALGWEPDTYTVKHHKTPYTLTWLSQALNASEKEVKEALFELSQEEEPLWEVEVVRPGCYYITVSDYAAEEYKEYYPYVFHTGRAARKLGLNETTHYEHRMRERKGLTEAWLNTSSEWRTGSERKDHDLYPSEFPEASGAYAYARDPQQKWQVIYELLDPITSEPFYIGITGRKMLTRLMEHLERPEITVSEAQGKPQKEHNPLMGERIHMYQSLGLEPTIRKRKVVQGAAAARDIEGSTIRKLEAEGIQLLNSTHSKDRPDNRWRKENRKRSR